MSRPNSLDRSVSSGTLSGKRFRLIDESKLADGNFRGLFHEIVTNALDSICSSKDHDDPAGRRAILRVKDESLQSRAELLPGLPVLPFPGPAVGLFRDKGKS